MRLTVHTWLHGRRYLILILTLALVALAAVGLLRDRPFAPQASYETTVGGSPDGHRFDLVAGQTLGARFSMSHSKDRRLCVDIASVSEDGGGLWHRDGIAEGYGTVSDGSIIWFEAPGTGSYSLEISTQSGERVHLTVQYCIE